MMSNVPVYSSLLFGLELSRLFLQLGVKVLSVGHDAAVPAL